MSINEGSARSGIDRLEKLYGSKVPISSTAHFDQIYTEKRKSVRQTCFNDAWIDCDALFTAIPAIILNSSSTGMLVSVDCKISIPNFFVITTGLMQFEVSVKWRKKNLIGTRIVEMRQARQIHLDLIGQRKEVSEMVSDFRRTLLSIRQGA